MIRACVRLGHDRFWYTILSDYYSKNVVDFYNRLDKNDESGVFYVLYDDTRHPITIELKGAAMNVHCGYTVEQFLKGSLVFQHWVDEIVLGGKVMDGYVKLGGLGKNQLLFFAWLNENIVPEDKQLNRRIA